MQVLLGAVLVDAAHPALENREVALDRIGMRLAADVLAGRVAHRLVPSVLAADLRVEAALVGHQLGLAGRVGAQDLADLFLGRGLRMEGANLATALHQTNDRALAAGAARVCKRYNRLSGAIPIPGPVEAAVKCFLRERGCAGERE